MEQNVDETNIGEIDALQTELAALLAHMDRVDPVQQLRDKIALESATALNADLDLDANSRFDPDKMSSGSDQDDDDYDDESDEDKEQK